MDASHLTVSPDTLRFQKMSRGKRAKLRRQNIIDLVQSKPYGTPIAYTDFAAVTQTVPSAARSLAKAMVRKGAISQDQIGGQKYTYRVNGPVTTRPLEVAKPVMPVPPPTAPTAAARRSVSDYAKEYFWETNDDNLHSFIAWMDKKELLLRREAAHE